MSITFREILKIKDSKSTISIDIDNIKATDGSKSIQVNIIEEDLYRLRYGINKLIEKYEKIKNKTI